MNAVVISPKGQVVLPIAVRKALGLKPGMRVNVIVEGKRAVLTPAPAAAPASLEQLQAMMRYEGPAVTVGDMRVTDCKGR